MVVSRVRFFLAWSGGEQHFSSGTTIFFSTTTTVDCLFAMASTQPRSRLAKMLAAAMLMTLSMLLGVTASSPLAEAESHQRTFSVNEPASYADDSHWPETIKFATNYYPSQWPRSMWASDASRMANSSITHVRISEFDWALLEPREGEYDWSVLDDSIDVLTSYGLKVILGTPTCTPPAWVVFKYDVLGVDNDLQVRRFGSRRHYSFSSPDYRRLSDGITRALAERYGAHPGVSAWQLDNEFGNSRTARSYDVYATRSFQQWLRRKYNDDIAQLNERQGRVFWSSQFDSFEQIKPPTLENEESSPALRLDYYHFSSDELIDFAARQAQVVRDVAAEQGVKHKPITTNFMGFELSFDHYEFVRQTQLDFATWDSYPLGNGEQLTYIDDTTKRPYARTGLPDHQALQHSIFRGVAAAGSNRTRGPWGVMEQQPGPVNWASANPSPASGQVRLWLHDMLSVGSSLNNIFRWRQAPYAQEQFHAGMLRPDDEYDVAWHEQQQAVEDVQKLEDAGVDMVVNVDDHADVALVMDFTTAWFIEAQPQSGRFERNTFVDYTFQYGQVLATWYEALRRLAIDVDIVAPWADLSRYKLVLVPTMVNVTKEADAALRKYKGEIIVGPRTASKVDPLSIPDGLPPSAGTLRDRLPMKVTRVESIRVGGLGDHVQLRGALCPPSVQSQRNCSFPINVWSEWLECKRGSHAASEAPGAVYAGYRDGQPAMCTNVDKDLRTTYIGWYIDVDALMPIMADAAVRNSIDTLLGEKPDVSRDLGGHVRIGRRGDALFVFNYDDKRVADVPLPSSSKWKLIVGGVGGNDRRVAISGVNIYHVA